ncbi:Serine palmitoyltransferase 1 [Neolecta irregularis DAH-3]|uniref:serine C-palmitoyltransferase n=1 Tax=Neolecta irregularis (strain DAH-3) TaxID=1198029 RepID=A0A1U7LTA3_NEOID|nr:Serine palmitoyltransferase 1 [Neolecta irregularis DAH-3]|eukprot:OLL25906.1 Serine palmitoyltransferase 1 [Neolecta irregularis DAH-3]
MTSQNPIAQLHHRQALHFLYPYFHVYEAAVMTLDPSIYVNLLVEKFHLIPGSQILMRYIKSSYQDDPIRSIIELFLVFFTLRYLLSKRYRPDKNYVKFTQQVHIHIRVYSKGQEIDDLVDEWQPESLVTPLSRQDQTELDKIPVIIGPAGPKVRIQSHPKPVLSASTFNFLNLHSSCALRERAVSALRTYGVGACGPPGFYGTQDVHVNLEKELATFLDVPASIIYAQAYSTVSSVIPSFAKRGDIIVADKGISFPIQKGLSISRSTILWYEHNDVDSLELVLDQVRREFSKKPLTRRFIVTEGLFESTGKILDLPKILELKRKFKYRLILDESISFGTLGRTGRGISEHWGCHASDIDILIGSYAHAISSAGGFCAGSEEVVAHQRINSPSYVFSAALPAMLGAVSIGALEILKKDDGEMIKTLRELTKVMRTGLNRIDGISVSGDSDSPMVLISLKEPVPEEDKILQDIVDECINNGILITRTKRVGQEMWPVRSSLRLCVGLGMAKRDVERTISVLRGAFNRRRSR